VCKSLCDELNGIMATFPIFDEISQSASEAPKGPASAEQLLKQKRFFIKAVELGTEKYQAAKEREMRIRRTAETVQVCLQQNTRTCKN
jgi:hypothetical protein